MGAAVEVQKKITRIVARFSVVVVVNLGCTLPLLLRALELHIMDPSITGFLFVSLGIWNNLIYFIGDRGIRERITGFFRA